MRDEQELEGTMRIELDVGVQLAGGSVLVTVGEETAGVRLTKLVADLVESREGYGGVMTRRDVDALEGVRHELWLASEVLAQRVALERDRRVARGEAL